MARFVILTKQEAIRETG